MRYIRFKKLEQFCLHVIVENLEKFIYSKNVPQKHIDFLLRVYSEEVFKKFSHREQVSEDCMLWFLNPHSKKVQLTTVSEKIASQLQIVGSTITSLSLKDSFVPKNMIDAIISFVPNVVHLDLSKSQCTDNSMLCIQRTCHVLVSLNLSNCKITCGGLTNLCGTHQSLKSLDLTRTRVRHNGIRAILKGFPLLEQLKIEGMAVSLYNIHRRRYASTNIRYNLTELIYDKTFSKTDLKVLHAWTILCPYVTRVYFDCYLTQRELGMCSRFEYLEVLEIKTKVKNSHSESMFVDEDEWQEDMNYDSVNVLSPFIPKGSRLTKLVLTSAHISIKILMECFENLRTLSLINVTFTDFREDDIALKDNKLDVLVLKQIPLHLPITCQAVLSLVSVSTNVTALSLINIKPPPNVCDAILNAMKNLSYVRFTAFVPAETIPSMHSFFQRLFEISSLEVYVHESLSFEAFYVPRAEFSIDAFPSIPMSAALSWSLCDYDSDDSVDNDDFDDESYESTEDSDDS